MWINALLILVFTLSGAFAADLGESPFLMWMKNQRALASQAELRGDFDAADQHNQLIAETLAGKHGIREEPATEQEIHEIVGEVLRVRSCYRTRPQLLETLYGVNPRQAADDPLRKHVEALAFIDAAAWGYYHDWEWRTAMDTDLTSSNFSIQAVIDAMVGNNFAKKGVALRPDLLDIIHAQKSILQEDHLKFATHNYFQEAKASYQKSLGGKRVKTDGDQNPIPLIYLYPGQPFSPKVNAKMMARKRSEFPKPLSEMTLNELQQNKKSITQSDCFSAHATLTAARLLGMEGCVAPHVFCEDGESYGVLEQFVPVLDSLTGSSLGDDPKRMCAFLQTFANGHKSLNLFNFLLILQKKPKEDREILHNYFNENLDLEQMQRFMMFYVVVNPEDNKARNIQLRLSATGKFQFASIDNSPFYNIGDGALGVFSGKSFSEQTKKDLKAMSPALVSLAEAWDIGGIVKTLRQDNHIAFSVADYRGDETAVIGALERRLTFIKGLFSRLHDKQEAWAFLQSQNWFSDLDPEEQEPFGKMFSKETADPVSLWNVYSMLRKSSLYRHLKADEV